MGTTLKEDLRVIAYQLAILYGEKTPIPEWVTNAQQLISPLLLKDDASIQSDEKLEETLQTAASECRKDLHSYESEAIQKLTRDLDAALEKVAVTGLQSDLVKFNTQIIHKLSGQSRDFPGFSQKVQKKFSDLAKLDHAMRSGVAPEKQLEALIQLRDFWPRDTAFYDQAVTTDPRVSVFFVLLDGAIADRRLQVAITDVENRINNDKRLSETEKKLLIKWREKLVSLKQNLVADIRGLEKTQGQKDLAESLSRAQHLMRIQHAIARFKADYAKSSSSSVPKRSNIAIVWGKPSLLDTLHLEEFSKACDVGLQKVKHLCDENEQVKLLRSSAVEALDVLQHLPIEAKIAESTINAVEILLSILSGSKSAHEKLLAAQGFLNSSKYPSLEAIKQDSTIAALFLTRCTGILKYQQSIKESSKQDFLEDLANTLAEITKLFAAEGLSFPPKRSEMPISSIIEELNKILTGASKGQTQEEKARAQSLFIDLIAALMDMIKRGELQGALKLSDTVINYVCYNLFTKITPAQRSLLGHQLRTLNTQLQGLAVLTVTSQDGALQDHLVEISEQLRPLINAIKKAIWVDGNPPAASEKQESSADLLKLFQKRVEPHDLKMRDLQARLNAAKRQSAIEIREPARLPTQPKSVKEGSTVKAEAPAKTPKELEEDIKIERQAFFDQNSQSFINILSALEREIKKGDFSRVALFAKADIDILYEDAILPLLKGKDATKKSDIMEHLKKIKELLLDARILSTSLASVPISEKPKEQKKPDVAAEKLKDSGAALFVEEARQKEAEKRKREDEVLRKQQEKKAKQEQKEQAEAQKQKKQGDLVKILKKSKNPDINERRKLWVNYTSAEVNAARMEIAKQEEMDKQRRKEELKKAKMDEEREQQEHEERMRQLEKDMQAMRERRLQYEAASRKAQSSGTTTELTQRLGGSISAAAPTTSAAPPSGEIKTASEPDLKQKLLLQIEDIEKKLEIEKAEQEEKHPGSIKKIMADIDSEEISSLESARKRFLAALKNAVDTKDAAQLKMVVQEMTQTSGTLKFNRIFLGEFVKSSSQVKQMKAREILNDQFKELLRLLQGYIDYLQPPQKGRLKDTWVKPPTSQ